MTGAAETAEGSGAARAGRLAGVARVGLLLATTGIYAYSAWSKWTDPLSWDLALQGYGLAPSLQPLMRIAVPAGETALVAALLLVWIWAPRWLDRVLWLSALGFVAFTAAMSWALATGRGLTGCGCFGGNDPITIWDIARDLVFLVIAAGGALAWRRAVGAGDASPASSAAPGEGREVSEDRT